MVLREDLTALDDLDLSGALLDGIQADGLICMGTIFDRASFKAADLYWMIAIQASFRNAILDACVSRGANLEDTDFSGASLKFVGFRLDNLGGRTNLFGADLSTAVLDGADFTGASCDSETKFPAGFDPVARGLIIEPLDR